MFLPMSRRRSLSLGGALALICCAPCVKAQYAGRERKEQSTATQSIQTCEAPTNRPGGNPGRTTSTTKSQSPFSNGRNDYLLAGTYGVYSQAWQGGDYRAGWARISYGGSPGLYTIQTPKGTAVMTYCYTVDGNPVFEVGGRKVRFNKLQAPGSGLIFYDVWWLSAKNERTGTPETWKLGQ